MDKDPELSRHATSWFIQPPSKANVDYSSAQRYGSINFFLNPDHRSSANPKAVLNRLRSTVQYYEPGDYIAWAGGDPWNLFMAGMAFGELNKPVEFNLLVWEKMRTIDGSTPNKNGFYIPINFSR